MSSKKKKDISVDFYFVPGWLEYQEPEQCSIPVYLYPIIPATVKSVKCWRIAPHSYYLHMIRKGDNKCGSGIVQVVNHNGTLKYKSLDEGSIADLAHSWCHVNLSHKGEE